MSVVIPIKVEIVTREGGQQQEVRIEMSAKSRQIKRHKCKQGNWNEIPRIHHKELVLSTERITSS